MVHRHSFIAGRNRKGGHFIFIIVSMFPTLTVEALISNGFTHGRLVMFTLSQLGVVATCGYLVGGLIGAATLTSSGRRRKKSKNLYLVISPSIVVSSPRRIPYSPPIAPPLADSGVVHEIFTKK